MEELLKKVMEAMTDFVLKSEAFQQRVDVLVREQMTLDAARLVKNEVEAQLEVLDIEQMVDKAIEEIDIDYKVSESLRSYSTRDTICDIVRDMEFTVEVR